MQMPPFSRPAGNVGTMFVNVNSMSSLTDAAYLRVDDTLGGGIGYANGLTAYAMEERRAKKAAATLIQNNVPFMYSPQVDASPNPEQILSIQA